MKPRILYIVHAFHNLAGVEEFLKNLVASLPAEYEPWIVFPYKGALHLGRPPIPRDDPTTYRFPFTSYNILVPNRDALCEKTLEYILDLVNPDICHIVHFVGYPLSMFESVLNRGKPTVITFHDYYAIHPYYTLTGCPDAQHALTPEYSTKVLKQDLSEYVNNRVKVLGQILEHIPYQIVPSPYLKKFLSGVYPDRFEVIEYGIDPFEVPEPRRDWSGFRFGFYGSLLEQKGWDTLLAPFERVRRRHPEAELHYFGGVAEPRPGVTFHGLYFRPAVGEVMSRCDAAFIPSRFAETYSMVLSELWRSRVPTAVADIGAMGERVIDGINGRKFRPEDGEGIEAVMEWFLTSDEWRSWKLPEPRTTTEMTAEYDSLYRSALERRPWKGQAVA